MSLFVDDTNDFLTSEVTSLPKLRNPVIKAIDAPASSYAVLCAFVQCLWRNWSCLHEVTLTLARTRIPRCSTRIIITSGCLRRPTKLLPRNVIISDARTATQHRPTI